MIKIPNFFLKAINASFEEALFTVAFNVTDDVSGVNFESAHFETDRVNSATDCYNRTIYGYENSKKFPFTIIYSFFSFIFCYQ